MLNKQAKMDAFKASIRFCTPDKLLLYLRSILESEPCKCQSQNVDLLESLGWISYKILNQCVYLYDGQVDLKDRFGFKQVL